MVQTVDATAGLPAGTTWSNGLPFNSLGQLCVSSNTVQTWSGGVPFDINGAVCCDGLGGTTILVPAMSLDFSTGVLDSRVTFTRASGGTRVNSSGAIELMTTNTPRFDYDPVTLAAKGLLIEEQRTNLLTYSEQFDNAVWVKTAATVTANAVASPDGATTADKLVESATTGVHSADQSSTCPVGTYTFTVFLKAAERSFAFVGMSDNVSALTGAYVNLTNGQVTTAPAGTWTNLSASSVNMSNGWWRCSVTATRVDGTNITNRCLVSTGVGTTSYAGNGTSGLYIWGAQLEAGSFATSYIPTTTAQATRAADVAVMTGTNFSTWYSQSQGTVYAQFDNYTTSTFKVIQFDDGTNFNALTGSTSLSQVNSPSMTVTGLATYVPNVVYKSSHSYKLNDFSHVVNGGTVATNTSGTPVTPTTARIGSGVSGQYLNGHIKVINFFNTALSSVQQQAITA